jgi:hypothetical protein
MRSLKKVALAFSVWAPFLGPTVGQEIRFDPFSDGKADSGYRTKWDSAQDRLIAYRDISVADIPAARVFRRDGSSTAVYPLKDLSDARYIDIWSASAAPKGRLVIAGILGYAARESKPVLVKSVILTYDQAGTLREMWDVAPYHHHHLCVDRDGSVFAIGDRDDVEGSYPLLTKYSSDGRVLSQFLPSSLFSLGDVEISSGSPNGESQMFVKGDQLFVWLAPTREFFSFSMSGELLSRTSLDAAFREIEKSNNLARLQVLAISAHADKTFVAQVRLWPANTASPATMRLAKFSVDGASGALLEPSPEPTRHFLGISADDKMVFLGPTSTGISVRVE